MRELGLSVRKSITTQVWVRLVIDLYCLEEQLLNCYGYAVKGGSFFYCCYLHACHLLLVARFTMRNSA